MKKVVIALSREYGSGGCEVAEKLSQKLGIEYYDHDLIRLAAEKKGIAVEVAEAADEMKAKPWEQPVPSSLSVFNDRLFEIQSAIIREKAEQESCIIVGRCADQVLKDREDCISIYIYADKEFRIKRIKEAAEISREEAEKLIRRVDKNRRTYYHYYTDGKWGQASNYDLAINTAKFGIDGAVDAIVHMVSEA